MSRCLVRLVLSVALLATAALAPPPAAAASCEDLKFLVLPDTTITLADSVPAGSFDPPGPTPPITNLPAFCRVSLTVAPQINVEVWLPAENWNQRFQAVGGGGYAGVISWAALGDALRNGYATASTDTGHDATVTPGGSFALHPNGTLNWQLITDFASRSLHEMTVKAKGLIRAFYGEAPQYSYWIGCSTGGRQGLMEAQRFPGDYNGILSGAPAINWDRFIPAELWPQIVMKQVVGQPIAACKFTTVNNAALAACDGLDGVVDGVLDDPRRCDFDPQVLQCAPGATPDCNCLTAGEVEAVRKIWDGARGTDGQRLWYGLEPTTSFAGLAGPLPFAIALDHFRYWLERNPTFDWHTLDYARFEADFKQSIALFNDVIGTDNPDLSGFRDSGGKVLIWHGWIDQLIFPRGTIDYYKRVLAAMGRPKRVNAFARLFMAPGVAHCRTGPGPNAFGQGGPFSTPLKADAEHDMFRALVRWVEEGIAPDRIIATKYVSDDPAQGVARTRPLCVYPKVARYKGKGSTDDAANFRCVKPRGHKRDHDHGFDDRDDD